MRVWNTGPVWIPIRCLQASGLFDIVIWLLFLFQGLVSLFRVSAKGYFSSRIWRGGRLGMYQG
jgi:hypothetical protein